MWFHGWLNPLSGRAWRFNDLFILYFHLAWVQYPSLVRTPREINHCADVLAKQGICKAEHCYENLYFRYILYAVKKQHHPFKNELFSWLKRAFNEFFGIFFILQVIWNIIKLRSGNSEITISKYWLLQCCL